MTGWAVVVPVKSWASAKSRVTGIGTSDRRALAMALACDTMRTVRGTPNVVACFAVGPREVVADLARRSRARGCFGVDERPGERDPLNAALRRGRDAAVSAGHRHIALLPADLPGLTTSALREVLEQIPGHRPGFVRDREGTGTVLLASRQGPLLAPAFGAGSADRHRARGAMDLSGLCDEAARSDLDTDEDLYAARSVAGPSLARWFRRQSVPGHLSPIEQCLCLCAPSGHDPMTCAVTADPDTYVHIEHGYGTYRAAACRPCFVASRHALLT